jgi:hypothetical protein
LEIALFHIIKKNHDERITFSPVFFNSTVNEMDLLDSQHLSAIYVNRAADFGEENVIPASNAPSLCVDGQLMFQLKL